MNFSIGSIAPPSLFQPRWEEEDEHRRTGERRKPGLDAISEKTN